MKIGLCKGRHEMPVEDYLFPMSINIFDYHDMQERIARKIPFDYKGCVQLYVTGITTAVVEVIKYCVFHGITLELMHFNRDTNGYVVQVVC